MNINRRDFSKYTGCGALVGFNVKNNTEDKFWYRILNNVNEVWTSTCGDNEINKVLLRFMDNVMHLSGNTLTDLYFPDRDVICKNIDFEINKKQYKVNGINAHFMSELNLGGKYQRYFSKIQKSTTPPGKKQIVIGLDLTNTNIENNKQVLAII